MPTRTLTKAQSKGRKTGKPSKSRSSRKKSEKKPEKKEQVEEDHVKTRAVKCEGQKGRYFFDETTHNNDFDAFTDAEIARCKKRISEGYAVDTYQKKLKMLEEAKQERREIIQKHDGMKWETIQRITSLKNIAKDLTKNDDPYKELKNVQAIISAYEHGRLSFDGNATYWCQGKQLESPKKFDWADVRRINTEENRGDGGFWVEGLFGPSPQRNNYRTYRMESKDEEHFVYLKVGIRLDHRLVEDNTPDDKYPPTHEMEFLDDTGADGVHIFEDDLLELMANEEKALLRDNPLRHVLGYHEVQSADNRASSVLVVAMQINMWGEENGARVLMRDEWEEMAVFVIPGKRVAFGRVGDRLMGNWPRSLFWVGSVPSIQTQFLASTEKDGLISIIPDVPEEDIQSYAAVTRPDHGNQWTRHSVNGDWHWGIPLVDESQEGRTARDLIESGDARLPIAPPRPPSYITGYQSPVSTPSVMSYGSRKSYDSRRSLDIQLPRPLLYPRESPSYTGEHPSRRSTPSDMLHDLRRPGHVGLSRPSIFPPMSPSSMKDSPQLESTSEDTPMEDLDID